MNDQSPQGKTNSSVFFVNIRITFLFIFFSIISKPHRLTQKNERNILFFRRRQRGGCNKSTIYYTFQARPPIAVPVARFSEKNKTLKNCIIWHSLLFSCFLSHAQFSILIFMDPFLTRWPKVSAERQLERHLLLFAETNT